jgi:hypothetical protein
MNAFAGRRVTGQEVGRSCSGVDKDCRGEFCGPVKAANASTRIYRMVIIASIFYLDHISQNETPFVERARQVSHS